VFNSTVMHFVLPTAINPSATHYFSHQDAVSDIRWTFSISSYVLSVG
jgi:hypothetical protein